jgi:uncharacterized membrane protein
MPISRELRDLAGASSFSALLFALGALVPLVGPPAGFFSAAPLVWLAARHGPRVGVLGAALACALLLPALPPPIALIYLLEHGGPACYLGWRIRGGRGIVAGSAVAAAVVTLLMAGAALFFASSGQEAARLLEQQLRAALAEFGGATGAGAPGALTPELEALLSFVRRVLPAVTLIGVFVECALNSLLALRVLARAGLAAPPPAMTRFALPAWLIWVLILALALCWAPQAAVATWALNALLPLLAAYLLQGLSITLHLANRLRVSRFGRVLFACSLVFFPGLLAGPLLLGLLDFRFGFRERWPLV